MDRRAVRRWFGKPGRRFWHVGRLTQLIAQQWDEWLGQLSLKGVDPRGWDLNQMLAAFEATMRRGAKDEAEWNRVQAQLRAEPPEVRSRRREEARQAALSGRAAPSRGGMSVGAAEALVAQWAASDAAYTR